MKISKTMKPKSFPRVSFFLIVASSIFVYSEEYVFGKEILVSIDAVWEESSLEKWRNEFENHLLETLMSSNDNDTLGQSLLAEMNSDEIQELNQQLLAKMNGEERERLEQSPLLKMGKRERDELCEAAREKASLRDDTEAHSYTHLYKIRKEKTDMVQEKQTVVAIRCASIPVAYLRLGDSHDKLEIMFSYLFTTEAIASIHHVSDPKVKAEFKKNHFLTLAQEELWAICNIASTRTPLKNISFRDSRVDEPRVFEINHDVPKFRQPEIKDVVIECHFDPITVYLRHCPINEVKIMIIESELEDLLGLVP